MGDMNQAPKNSRGFFLVSNSHEICESFHPQKFQLHSAVQGTQTKLAEEWPPMVFTYIIHSQALH